MANQYDITQTAGWVACQQAKADYLAEVGVSGANSYASQVKKNAYVAAMKVCTEQAGIKAPW